VKINKEKYKKFINDDIDGSAHLSEANRHRTKGATQLP
jgi:hypothetical protein